MECEQAWQCCAAMENKADFAQELWSSTTCPREEWVVVLNAQIEPWASQGKAPLRGFGLNKGKKINLLSEIQTDLFGRVMLADPASFDSSGCWGQACAFGLFSASAGFVSSQGEDEAVTLKSCTRRKTDSIEKRFCFDVEAVDR